MTGAFLFWLSAICLLGINLILIAWLKSSNCYVGFEMIYEWCVFLLFPCCLIYAGISDVISLTIPNKISLILIGGFICLAPFSGLSMAEIGMHGFVGFVVLAVGLLLFGMGWLGGGDVKLIAASALWFGPENLAMFLYAMAFYGGVLCIIWFKLRTSEHLLKFSSGAWLQRLVSQKSVVPYGIAIGLAGLTVYPQTHWLGLV